MHRSIFVFGWLVAVERCFVSHVPLETDLSIPLLSPKCPPCKNVDCLSLNIYPVFHSIRMLSPLCLMNPRNPDPPAKKYLCVPDVAKYTQFRRMTQGADPTLCTLRACTLAERAAPCCRGALRTSGPGFFAGLVEIIQLRRLVPKTNSRYGIRDLTVDLSIALHVNFLSVTLVCLANNCNASHPRSHAISRTKRRLSLVDHNQKGCV
jgi:hypothetical protein